MFPLNPLPDDMPTEKILSQGDAAELMLKNVAVQEFLRDKSLELYSQFIECAPEDVKKIKGVICAQQVVVGLIEYLQTAVAHRNKITGLEPEAETETQKMRERILGLSGMPS